MSANPEAQQKLQSLTDEYQKVQTDLQESIAARQRLEAQEQENIGVQNEFKSLAEDSNIYKLIGPVLVKQERVEAVSAVDGRLEYIRGEIKRMETQLSSLQEKSDGKRMEIYQLQMQLQQQGQSEGQTAQQTQAVA